MENKRKNEKLKNKKSVQRFFAIALAVVLMFSVLLAVSYAVNTPQTDNTNTQSEKKSGESKSCKYQNNLERKWKKNRKQKNNHHHNKKGAKIKKNSQQHQNV